MLSPAGKLQGTNKFLSLGMVKKVKRRAFIPCPMPDLVIRKVEALGYIDHPPRQFGFADRNGILFEWNIEVDKFPGGDC